MPPIKRTQKPGGGPPRRKLAGHPGAVRSEAGAPGAPGAPGTAGTAGTASTARAGGGQGRGDGGVTPGSTGTDESRRVRVSGRALAYAALVVGVAAGAAGAYLATEPGVDVSNAAFINQSETDEVLAAATANVQRLVAIDHESLDEYHDSLGEYLTPNLVSELDENWPALRESYEQTATAVDANVSEAGLAYLEGDRAEVLLVQDVSMTRDGAAAGSTSGTYLVGLDKVDGVWKLSRIPDLPS